VNAGRHPVHAALACAFIALAIYGSWYPFEYRPRPAGEAAWIFVNGIGLDERISLTDAASNLLLFLPIGLFAAAWLQRPRPRDAVAIVAGGALLSTVVEFGQAFTLWRTPSLLDVAAETAGTAAGVAIWYPLADELNRATRHAAERWRAATTGERALWIYLAVFAFAWLLPFDFTLRPDEIGDKYSHKRLLWPMTPSPDAATRLELLGAVIAAIPLGAAGMICGNTPGVRRSFPAACAAVVFGLVALTMLQVTVFSRTTDLTVFCVALAGVIAGALLARPARSGRGRSQSSTVQSALIITLWLIATSSHEWSPFHFILEVGRAWREVAEWANAPFRAIGLADLLPSMVLAAIAGAAVRQRLTTSYVRLQSLTAIALAGTALVWIEGLRLLLPGRAPTLLAAVMQAAAFVTPLALAMLRRSQLQPRTS
jgi:VanZ family protein